MIGKKHTYRVGVMLILTILTALLGFSVNAGDPEAQIELENAKKLFDKADYRGAAKAYRAAELYADSPYIKYDALTKAADAFAKAGQKYKQFKCYENLIAGFPDRINFTEIVDAEYKIGNAFQEGYRDTPLYWLPWIKDSNKAPEIYEKILKQAPFAKFAPALKLKLGRIYLEEEKNEKALRTFRQIIKQHPKTKEEKYARFELANALVQLSSKAGDGDGAYAREAEAVLNETLKVYPKDPETLWIKQSINETDNVRSERLYNLAEFYESRDNPEAAKRYFNDLISRFPDSPFAKKSEEHLKKLDPEYKPKKLKKREKLNLYPVIEMEKERDVILVAPEASGGKWLLPIEDLDLDGSHAEEDYQAAKRAKEEALKKAKAKRAADLAAKKKARKKLLAKQQKKKRAEEEAQQQEDAQKETERREKIKEEAEKVEATVKAEKLKKEEAKKRAKKTEKEKKEAKKADKTKKQNSALTAVEKGTDSGTDIVVNADNSKSKSSAWTYLIPIILILLALLAIIILYIKKKRQV